MVVERVSPKPNGYRILLVDVGKHRVEICVSPEGRSVRVREIDMSISEPDLDTF